jgi:hypothetical protein
MVMIALGEPSLEPSQRVRIEKSSSAKIRKLRLGQRGRKHGIRAHARHRFAERAGAREKSNTKLHAASA